MNTTPEPLRALIVDDEPPARRLLASLVAAESDMHVVGECGSAQEALAAIPVLDPHFILLDIEMPGGSGLDLARQIDPVEGPVLIFITAHEQFAAEAYEVWPADYILKPLQAARWQRALNRVRRIVYLRSEAALVREPARPSAPARYLDRTFVRSDDRIRPIRFHDVCLIEAVGNYVKLHTADATHLLRSTLGAVELRLDPRRFFRAHKSYIVNVDAIREIIALTHGEYRIVLDDGVEIPMGRRYRSTLDRFTVAAVTK